MSDDKPQYLTISQAASRLGIHPKTLRAWTDKGLVPHHRLLSGYRRYDPKEIEQLSLKMRVPDRKEEEGS
jgi:MerR family transcriptional regulator, repressor of the yfmOP operon